MILTKSLWLKFLIFNLKSLHSKIFQIAIKNQMILKIDLKKIFLGNPINFKIFLKACNMILMMMITNQSNKMNR